MLHEASQRHYIAKHMPEGDAYTLLQPLAGDAGAQFQIYKGLNLEPAMCLATLTGSAIHFDTGAHWEQLLMDAQPAGLRQARGKVERKELPTDDNDAPNARLELHVPPRGTSATRCSG